MSFEQSFRRLAANEFDTFQQWSDDLRAVLREFDAHAEVVYLFPRNVEGDSPTMFYHPGPGARPHVFTGWASELAAP
jgi:hypothetical protein